jgi:hypothetical protein
MSARRRRKETEQSFATTLRAHRGHEGIVQDIFTLNPYAGRFDDGRDRVTLVLIVLGLIAVSIFIGW